jgi:hypothetical protein
MQMVRTHPVLSIYQAGTTLVVFSMDMNSSSYHIMVGAMNPHLLSMYYIGYKYLITIFVCQKTRINIFLKCAC